VRLALTLSVLVVLAWFPSKASAQAQADTYYKVLLEEGDDRMLGFVAERPYYRDIIAILIDPNDPSGFTAHEIRYDCAGQTYGNTSHRFTWDRRAVGRAEQLEHTLQRRFGMDYGSFNRQIVCDRAHERGGAFNGLEEALAEGRQWQRFNPSSAVLSRSSCEQLSALMSEAISEYGFGSEFARFRLRIIPVAQSKRCEWSRGLD
jgi:hypothetical protein